MQPRCGLTTAANLQFPEEEVNVILDCSNAQAQFARDRFVGEPVADQPADLALAPGEWRCIDCKGSRRSRAIAPGPAEQHGRDAGTAAKFATHRVPDRGDQIAQRVVP